MNDFQFPRLTINRTYEKILRQPEAFSQEARQYLEEKMGSAMWLIKSIEQRRMTLYKVARCIAVSYTHLDVYKRQGNRCAGRRVF